MNETVKVVDISPKQRKIENLVKRKTNTASHPLSVVIMPRTKEGHMLSEIVKLFDRVFWFGVRSKIGPLTPVEEVKPYIDRCQDIIRKTQEKVGEVFNIFKTPEEKYYQARKMTSHVFIPRTQEGKILASYVEAIDNKILIAKSSDLSGDGQIALGGFFSIYNDLAQLIKDIVKDKKVETGKVSKHLKKILYDTGDPNETAQNATSPQS